MKRVLFDYDGFEEEGVIINELSENGVNKVVIKLSSGYNIVIPKSKLKIKKEIKREDKNKNTKNITKNKNNKNKNKGGNKKKGQVRIKILHTGGTIASKVDYETGAVIAKTTAEELLSLFPEIEELAEVRSELVSNIQSEMMRFDHWNRLSKEVRKAVDEGFDGVIITHGTDTMHYTTAALGFSLADIDIPVLLVGSQRSSDRPSTDAHSNLLGAVTFIKENYKKSEENGDKCKDKSGRFFRFFKGVGICMHSTIDRDELAILSPFRARKMHTSRRDAFKPIDDSYLAKVIKERDGSFSVLFNEELLKVHHDSRDSSLLKKLLGDDELVKKSGFSLDRFSFDSSLRIGFLKAHPNIFAEEVLAFKGFDGLILELLGIGHLPTMSVDQFTKEHEKVFSAIKELIKKGTFVVGAPQTIFGRVNMNVYSPGRDLLSAGVLGNESDLTPETAFVKVAFILSIKRSFDSVFDRFSYSENIAGELLPVLRKDYYF